MKKRIILSLIFGVLTILGSISALALSNRIVASYKEKDIIAYADITNKELVLDETTTEETITTVEVKETTVVNVKTEEYIVSGIVEAKGNISTYNLNLANKEINKIPENIRDLFVTSGWHIYVTNENIANTYFNGLYKSVEGVTDYENKSILIENKSNAITESIIHEFGHFIDYYNNFPTDYYPFLDIYNEEVETFKSGIPNSSCVRDSREFFAEEFYYYFKNPSKCTPKAYAYIEETLNNL